MTADPQVSEIEIVEHTAEGFNALLEDLLPMRHEEEAVLLARMRLAEACIIEGGDHGFPQPVIVKRRKLLEVYVCWITTHIGYLKCSLQYFKILCV